MEQLTTFKQEQSKLKQQLQLEVNKLQKEFEKSVTNLSKAKTRYYGLSKETDIANAAVEKAQNDASAAKELTKLKTKAQGLQKQAEQADQQYRNMVDEHREFQKKYEEEMKKYLSVSLVCTCRLQLAIPTNGRKKRGILKTMLR